MIASWIDVSDLADTTSPYAEDAVSTASFILYNLTGQKFPGIREVTEFYVDPNDECRIPFEEMLAHVSPRFVTSTSTLPLYGTPVRNILSVREGGIDLDPSEYVIVNRSRLRRLNCSKWATCGGIEVTYRYGVNPPRAGRLAAMRLADELVLALNNDPNCQLPEGVVSVSRQGIDISFIDPQDFIKEGRTGLSSVDMFIHATNPVQAHKRAKVFSTHFPQRERRI